MSTEAQDLLTKISSIRILVLLGLIPALNILFTFVLGTSSLQWNIFVAAFVNSNVIPYNYILRHKGMRKILKNWLCLYF